LKIEGFTSGPSVFSVFSGVLSSFFRIARAHHLPYSAQNSQELSISCFFLWVKNMPIEEK
jgi:hypothetical protein